MRKHELHPNLIAKWQKLHTQYAQNAFQDNGHAYTEDAKVAELERLIGQVTIENSLLKSLSFQERSVQEQQRKEAGQ